MSVARFKSKRDDFSVTLLKNFERKQAYLELRGNKITTNESSLFGNLFIDSQLILFSFSEYL